MKKIFTLAALAIAGASALPAMAENVFLLRHEEDTQMSMERHFYWNKNLTLQAIDEFLSDGDVRYFFYNDPRNEKLCTREENTQDLNFSGEIDQYTLVNAVDYVYDEQGRLIERTNFNLGFEINPETGKRELERQATYYLTYNEAGQLTNQDCYWDENKLNPYCKQTFTYNDKGQLTASHQDFYGFTSISITVDFAYSYDEQGRLVETLESQDEGGENVTKYTLYNFDENGDLVSVEDGQMNGTQRGSVQSKLEFAYSELPISQCVYPTYPEQTFTRDYYWDMMTHQLELMNTSQVQDGTWIETGNWEYTYEEVDPATFEGDTFNGNSGIPTIGAIGSFLRGAYVSGDILNISADCNLTGVAVYDLEGRRVLNPGTVSGNKLNVAGLEKGVYVLATRQGAVKFAR